MNSQERRFPKRDKQHTKEPKPQPLSKSKKRENEHKTKPTRPGRGRR